MNEVNDLLDAARRQHLHPSVCQAIVQAATSHPHVIEALHARSVFAFVHEYPEVPVFALAEALGAGVGRVGDGVEGLTIQP